MTSLKQQINSTNGYSMKTSKGFLADGDVFVRISYVWKEYFAINDSIITLLLFMNCNIEIPCKYR